MVSDCLKLAHLNPVCLLFLWKNIYFTLSCFSSSTTRAIFSALDSSELINKSHKCGQGELLQCTNALKLGHKNPQKCISLRNVGAVFHTWKTSHSSHNLRSSQGNHLRETFLILPGTSDCSLPDLFSIPTTFCGRHPMWLASLNLKLWVSAHFFAHHSLRGSPQRLWPSYTLPTLSGLLLKQCKFNKQWNSPWHPNSKIMQSCRISILWLMPRSKIMSSKASWGSQL